MKTLRHGITDGLPREQIQQNRQIDKARCDADGSNIGHPSLIDGRNGTILQKIGIPTNLQNQLPEGIDDYHQKASIPWEIFFVISFLNLKSIQKIP
jgi:hypothetical protein